MASLQIKRGTRAQLETAKAASGLLAGEPYLITNEARLAVGTAANAYSDAALKSEVDAKLPLISAQTEIGANLADDDVVAVYDTSATAHRKGLMSRIWTYISGKLTGAISGVLTSNLTASRAVVSDGSGKVSASSVTSTELGYLSGVTSALQTQLNAKAGLGYNIFSDPQVISYSSTHAAYLSLQNTITNGRTWALMSIGGGLAPVGYFGVDLYPDGLKFAITPTGNVLIGTATDGDSTKKLQVAGNTYVSGYSKLGESAPAIKMKKLTGTSPAAQGGKVSVAHGLNYTKIIGVQVLIETAFYIIPNGYTHYSGYQFDFLVSDTYVIVDAHRTNSGNILSQPFTVLVTYEE